MMKGTKVTDCVRRWSRCEVWGGGKEGEETEFKMVLFDVCCIINQIGDTELERPD